ncbi:MAG: pyridoxal phosphate-dependent aminotransferase [Nitrososphaerales archaeon]
MKEADFSPHVSLGTIFFRAKELERLGKDVIHFDAGEPDFGPPEQVIEATIRALKSGRSRYTEAAGISPVRESISDYLNDKYRINISPNQTLMTVGGRMALFYAFSTLPKNTRMGIISPDWSAYRDLCRFMGFEAIFFPTSLDNGWNIDIEAVKESNVNALVMNYPSNPTGKILELKSYDGMVDIASDKGITIIGDEVYSDYILNEKCEFKSILQTEGCKYIFTTSLSKSYSMTGYRAGYVAADASTISKIEKTSSLLLTSPPEFVQYATMAALQCREYARDKVETIKRRRNVASAALKKFLDADFYIPDGSLYIFPRLHNNRNKSQEKFDGEKFAQGLLEKESVSVTPGTSFGSWYKDHIRITLLQNEQRLEEGIERMANFLAHSGT